MYQKITDYVEAVFSDVKENSVTGFTKKGFIASITKKYEKNLEKGMSKEDAYDLAISQTPEIHDVARDMQKFMGRSSTFKKGDEEYHNFSPEHKNNDHKEGRDKNDDKNADLGNFSAIFWPLVVCTYFLVSFLVPGTWAFSWTIFVGAAIIHCFVQLFFGKADKKKAITSTLWLITTIIYLVSSILSGAWLYTWLIFVFAALLQCFVNVFTANTYVGKQAAAGGCVWLSITISYFLLSFITHRWDITWIIFIFGIAVHAIVKIIVEKAQKRD